MWCHWIYIYQVITIPVCFCLVNAERFQPKQPTWYVANPGASGPYVANPGELTRKEVGIWFPIIFFIVVIYSVVAIWQIDDVKNRDTILYAKFIANLKDKQNWVMKHLTEKVLTERESDQVWDTT